MNRKQCLMLVLASGAACASAAFAQTAITPGPKAVPGADGDATGITGGGLVEYPFGSAQSYGARAPGAVLDNIGGTSAFFASTTKAAIFCNHLLDEFTFAPGPWATAAVRSADQFQFAYFIQSYTGTGLAFDHVVNFYDNASPNYVGADMLDPDGAGPLPRATPTRSIRVAHAAGSFPDPGGGGYTIVSTVNLGGAGQPAKIDFTSDHFIVEVSAVDPGGNTFCYYDSAAFAGTTLFQAPSATPNTLFVGHFLEDKPIGPGKYVVENHARDMNGDGTFAGQSPVISGGGFNATTVLQDNRVSRISTTRPRSYAFYVRGDIVIPPPRVDIDLSCLADGSTTGAIVSRPIDEFRIIKFCLNGDANDNARKFLDIVGNPADDDVSVALYNSAGALVSAEAIDDNSGDGFTAPALTFGIGRRDKAFTGGVPLDGRNGELVAGTYYLMVGGPGAGYGDGFAFTPPALGFDPGGSANIRFITNTNAGALAPSVPPDPADYGGATLTLPPSTALADQQPPARRPAWNKFTLCEDLDTTGEYLDIDMGRTNPSLDTGMLLFDGTGNLIALNDDAGAVPLTSQLSFGAAGTPARTPLSVGGDPLNNQDGTLAAGDYYIATALLTVSWSGDRWHVRAQSGSSDAFRMDVNTSVDCQPDGCPCVADFDGSGGTPDAGDIDAFFSAWLLGDPSADSDCSGGTPDTGDIDVFFTEWLNGGC